MVLFFHLQFQTISLNAIIGKSGLTTTVTSIASHSSLTAVSTHGHVRSIHSQCVRSIGSSAALALVPFYSHFSV